MYPIVDLTRQTNIIEYYSPTVWPFVVSFKFYYGATDDEIADFWTTTFSVIEPATTRVYITGVVYSNSINYSSKLSLEDVIGDEQSYYWDDVEQILYIHLNHLQTISEEDQNFALGLAIGLTTDRIRYFNDRVYLPYLLNLPAVEIQVDKFNYNQMTFITDTLNCSNGTGFFNQFKEVPLYGNKVIIKTGEEGDTFEELITRATYFVEDYSISAKSFDINIQDVRKTSSAQVPSSILSIEDYPNIGSTSIGKTIPFGYGSLIDVPGLCVNEELIKTTVTTDYPEFIFLEVGTGSTDADIEIYVKDTNDAWQLQLDANYSMNWTTGIATVNFARTGTPGAYDVLEVKANLVGVAVDYASDIIKDMNDRFLNLSYDASTYDQTEWKQEEAHLKPVGLYMDSSKDVYDWIKELQSLSTVGFRYTSTPDNKRIIKVDNPNRIALFDVPSIHVKSMSEVTGVTDIDDVWNRIYIGYNHSILNDTATKVEDLTYYTESYDFYNIIKIYDKTTGLLNVTDATNRAAIQAEDYAYISLTFELTLIGEKYLDLKLYDILNIDISLVKKKFTYVYTMEESLDEGGLIEEVASSVSVLSSELASITVEDVGDDYFGTVRGQVISIKPDYKMKTNTIRFRQRDYSPVFEEWELGLDLLAHYTFDGDALDSSGNGNDGTLSGFGPVARYLCDGDLTDEEGGSDLTVITGTATYEAGVVGQGVGGVAFQDTNTTPGIQGFIAFWAKFSDNTGGVYNFLDAANAGLDNIFIRTNSNTLIGYQMYIHNNTAGTYQNVYSDPSTLKLNTYQHFVARWKDGVIDFIQDNRLIGSITATDGSGWYPSGQLYRLGQNYTLTGQVSDDFITGDYYISDAEISALYNRPQEPSYWVGDGVSGKALSFNGISASADSTAFIPSLPTWSLECLIKRAEDSGLTERLFSIGTLDDYDVWFQIATNDFLNCGFRESDDTAHSLSATSDAIAVDTLTYILSTFDGTYMKIYKDGSLIATSADWSAYTPATTAGRTLHIGRLGAGTWLYNYSGAMDAVRMYTRALTADEVSQRYTKLVEEGDL